MTPKIRSRIRSAIRKIWWMYSDSRKEALKRTKLARGFGWQCEKCRVPTKKPEVDHIEPVGSGSWDGIIERMFCEADGLMVLCKECHKAKGNK